MCNTPKYNRILLKLSGEALANECGELYDFSFIETVVSKIKKCVDAGVQIAIVIGGGNIWRGRSGGGMDRVRADRMGMLATVMNSIAVQDALISAGVDARIMTAVEIKGVGEAMSSPAPTAAASALWISVTPRKLMSEAVCAIERCSTSVSIDGTQSAALGFKTR